jgi:hypothetical protein
LYYLPWTIHAKTLFLHVIVGSGVHAKRLTNYFGGQNLGGCVGSSVPVVAKFAKHYRFLG